MLHIFINALSASAGGGLTYVRNVLPRLAGREGVRTTLLVGGILRAEISESEHLRVLNGSPPDGSGRRFWYEQYHLPNVIRRSGANILLSTGNFALYRSPVPQILLSRNALYTSADFLRDVRERGDYRLWIDTETKGAMARWSVKVADCTVAPSATFASELRDWTGKEVISIHHGFDHEAFFRQRAPLCQEVQRRLAATQGAVRVLFVSHYNYYRNFETLIRAIAFVKKMLHPRAVRLILTCKLSSKDNPGIYQADRAAGLVQQLELREEVVELGAVPYGALHHLYRSCDLYATPAYAETFAHPLVEAMASGLPVIASDLAVHREICGDAAQYFPRFEPEILAQRIMQLCESPQQRPDIREIGILRSRDFSWDKHVEQLLFLARSLAHK
ncbi:MAG TPA: glycosyltransferase family 1 protein [Candidatus Deferrimicrobiaceae bacterium]|nr:glycosyltransferase family 1 protein [Candidatus Deferrimicrobiaceae bacterium]